MALFQPSVLNKYLKLQDSEVTKKAYKKYVKHFHNATIQENIKNSKEEEYQGVFLTDLFVNILGYTMKPQPNYNLVAEQKNQTNAKKADGAILKGDTAIAVIELKGTKTKDLKTITEQAFGYKANQKGCVYVITSNYEKLRFYINDATDKQDFNLFTLSEQEFDLLYLCLSQESVFAGLPQKIKTESLAKEEQITKDFYKDYSLFKRELFRDLVKLNAKNLKTPRETALTNASMEQQELEKELDRLEKNVKLALFKKSQKLIDRFLFVFFAEDRGLLTPNSTLLILNKWKDDVAFGDAHPLYNMFKSYFNFLDTGRQAVLPKDGRKGRPEIYAYNGGLFKSDKILDRIEISDEMLYKHTLKLSNYDFDSQIDVNVLGHIFENSLNEIESVNAEIEGGDFDKQKSKRKKDGVFYTPKYITQYIVENTVGKLCEEKKTELGFAEEEYYKSRKGRPKATLEKLQNVLEEYREWLLQLTICDPACGSGAFLNQALDFLIREHRYIDELKTSLLGGGMVLSDIENTILENNIFGVDLNEESVEIAKLSLWLRTAQPKRKLNSLNSNIKCGNSLIESKAIAGDKAFTWEEEFPTIFEKGGFDVIIGNPPYVRVQGIKENYSYQTPFYEKNYEVATGRYDIYTLFIEKSYKILNKNGLVSFILPHNFLISDFGKGVRKFLSNNKAVNEIVHFGSEIVFKDASTYTCILTLSYKNKYINYKKISPSEISNEPKSFKIDYLELSNEKWNLQAIVNHKIFNKLNKKTKTVKDVFSNVSRGIVTGADSIFLLEGKIYGDTFKGYSKELQKEVELEAEIMRPILKGSSFSRYDKLNTSIYILYPHTIKEKTEAFSELELSEKYPKVFNYLLNFKETLITKKNKYKTNPEIWWSLHNSRDLNLLENKKIIAPYLSKRSQMTIDESGDFFTNDKCSLLKIKDDINHNYLPYLGIFNSSLFWFFIQNTSSEFSGGYFAYTNTFIEPFKLPEYSNEFENLINPVEKQLLQNISSQKIINSFILYLKESLSITVFNKKLQNWHELEFGEFIKELNKAIKSVNKERAKTEETAVPELTKSDEMEWMELFNKKKEEAQALKTQIDQTDREIDNMVYELYELTEEEIEIVENS